MIRIIFNWLRYITTSFSVATFWQNNMASSNKKKKINFPPPPGHSAPAVDAHALIRTVSARSGNNCSLIWPPNAGHRSRLCRTFQSFNTLYFIRATLTGNTCRQKQLLHRTRGRWRPVSCGWLFMENRYAGRSLFTWVTEANVRPPWLGVGYKVSAPPKAVYSHMSGLNLVKNVCFSDVMS